MSEMNLQDCFKKLIEMFQSGDWDFLCAAHCAVTIIKEILDRVHDHDHDNPVIGSDEFASDCCGLADALGIDVPSEGPVTNALLLMIAERLAKLLLEWLEKRSA